MDLKMISTFIETTSDVMPQLGFETVFNSHPVIRTDRIKASGVILTVGIIGELRGNIIYIMDLESAMKIASKMMMGMAVDELDEMSKSAISELANMLTANAAIKLSNLGKTVDISVPALIQGEDIEINLVNEEIYKSLINIDDVKIEINVAIS